MNIISKKQLDTANLAVTWELAALGFCDRPNGWVADGLDADRTYPMDWEDLDNDLIGAIAAIPQDDLLVSAHTRSVTCTVTAIQRYIKKKCRVNHDF